MMSDTPGFPDQTSIVSIKNELFCFGLSLKADKESILKYKKVLYTIRGSTNWSW